MSKTVKGPNNEDITTTVDAQTYTGINTFKNNSLAANGLTAEGFVKHTDTINIVATGAWAGTHYTVSRTGGPEVVITGYRTDTPAGLGVGKSLVADEVYNAVWNDLVDCIEVPDSTELEFGYCYCFDGETYHKSREYMEDGIVGIHSDTAGFFIGAKKKGVKVLNTAAAGFALAYVDKEYAPGTPLTCCEDGWLTEISLEDLRTNPHKLVGTFWKKEIAPIWGFDNPHTWNLLVVTNGRMWVKVR